MTIHSAPKPENGLVPTLTLRDGRRLSVVDDLATERIEIRSRTGDLEVHIELGPTGAKLRIAAVDIRLQATENLSIACGTLDVDVAGAARLHAAGQLSLQGEDVGISAPAGEIAIGANDDVAIRGERIQLNCDDAPMPLTWEEFEARTRRSLEGER